MPVMSALYPANIAYNVRMALDTATCSGVFTFTCMEQAMARAKGGKREVLARDGVLNPHPEAVRDALFADNPFFDPADLVQVRYEMVRRHEVDGQAISELAAKFGVSRPTFYKAQAALATSGLTGLLPGQRGPKGGHKLSDEMLAFDVDLRTSTPGMTMAERLAAIEHRFGIKLHRRSLERAVARKKK
jgi:transposase